MWPRSAISCLPSLLTWLSLPLVFRLISPLPQRHLLLLLFGPKIQTNQVHISDPEPYSGDLGKCKSFLLQCSLVFAQRPLTYESDDARISYLMGLLRGNALAWATAIWDSQSPHLDSYMSFTTEFRKVFDHPVTGKDASQRLFSLRHCLC